MIDMLVDMLEQLALAAMHDTLMATVVNDGPGAARIMAMDPENRMVMGAFVANGDSILINRAWRVLVQPIDHVLIRPLCIESAMWETV